MKPRSSTRYKRRTRRRINFAPEISRQRRQAAIKLIELEEVNRNREAAANLMKAAGIPILTPRDVNRINALVENLLRPKK